ncbi:pilus assembly protein TadG-related protein [Glaciibacter superstes]|uniref:pilus assembly protein TadG-related protein n=1 Tax=Glaciibacter superstes TaxID=501023 RepID=UPI0003B74F2D|nr:pilus assembly protein TadG-related protein [Glaciibacter superstes]
MRRLTNDRFREERGGMAVIVALAMVALLAAVAVTVDVGAIYAERAQLQNGADAAALAIAEDCAGGACGDPTATAQDLADSNANDDAATIEAVDFPATGAVHVTTSTREDGSNAGELALTFAPLLGIENAKVEAEATAAWGSPTSGPAVLPLAFAPCNFQLDGAIQVVSTHGASGGGTCSSISPSGRVLPGGFGWLADPTQTCSTTVSTSTNAAVSGSTGVSISSACSVVLSGLADETVLLPVYEDVGSTGSGGWYKIRGWAAFTILGWNFPGSLSSYHNTMYAGANCANTCKGLIGRFVSFVSLDDRFTMGGPNLGATIVTLTR